MPSFFSKVLGRKPKDTEVAPSRPSDGSLLEGKFEAISPTVSPTAHTFAESYGKERENGRFALFRFRSHTSQTVVTPTRVDESAPHLSLNIPVRKDGSTSPSPVLGVAFDANLEAHLTLSDTVIGEKRLNTAETLKLVQACSRAVIARGLETLGIMHPHWHSSSPDTQRKLISLFIKSLDSKTPTATLPSSDSSSESPFDSEINFTRSPHDVAAVLRWGLRHLQLDGKSFGKDPKWYETFSQAEKSSDYPRKAFTDQLVPLLPEAHLELLMATLELISSLAAHAEANGSSGSKVSKLLGYWLLTAQRVDKDKEDWKAFYASWDRTGRILEHLLLARIRELELSVPKRLRELVASYPYTKYAVEGDDLLPRPRFSTRRYSALLVRVNSELPPSGPKAKQQASRLVERAFRSELSSSGPDSETWVKIKKVASDAEEDASSERYPPLSLVFTDETVRLLSLVSGDSKAKIQRSKPLELSVPPAVAAPKAEASSRPHSIIDGAVNGPAVNGNLPSNAALTTPLPSSPMLTDWASFSSAGFGESAATKPLAATLMDKDVEKTQPAVRPKFSKKRKSPSRSGRRGASAETPHTPHKLEDEDEKDQKPSSATVSQVQLDEAFIDFWSDALLDPISATWPTFVICKLKSLPGVESSVSWLVIEQTWSAPAAVPASQQQQTSAIAAEKRPASPRPSEKSVGSKKKFNLFGRVRTFSEKSKKRKDVRDVKVGEMGQILDDEAGESEAKKEDEGNKDQAVTAKESTSAPQKNITPPVETQPSKIVPSEPEANGTVKSAPSPVTKEPTVEVPKTESVTATPVVAEPVVEQKKDASLKLPATPAVQVEHVEQEVVSEAPVLDKREAPAEEIPPPVEEPAPEPEPVVVEKATLRQEVVQEEVVEEPVVREEVVEEPVVREEVMEEPVAREEVVEETQAVVEEAVIEDGPVLHVEETGKMNEEPVPTVSAPEVSPPANEPTPEPVEQVTEAQSVPEETKESIEEAPMHHHTAEVIPPVETTEVPEPTVSETVETPQAPPPHEALEEEKPASSAVEHEVS